MLLHGVVPEPHERAQRRGGGVELRHLVACDQLPVAVVVGVPGEEERRGEERRGEETVYTSLTKLQFMYETGIWKYERTASSVVVV